MASQPSQTKYNCLWDGNWKLSSTETAQKYSNLCDKAWKTQIYHLHRDIGVQQCQCQGHALLSTDATCRN